MSDLKGENLIEQFRESAQRITTRIVSLDGIEGIVYMGALVRGFADTLSDVDITVFTFKDDDELASRVSKMAKEEEHQSGLETDVEVHPLHTFVEERWTEIRRWDFSNAQVVHDPRGQVQWMISKKLIVPESYWLRRIVPAATYMKWYCCPTDRGVTSLAEMMMKRGSPLAAHHQVNYGTELLLNTLFAVNREFKPPPKWMIFYSHDLRWLPRDYEALLSEAITLKNLSHKELMRRLNALRSMWSGVSDVLAEEWGLDREKIRKLYVRRVLKQTASNS